MSYEPLSLVFDSFTALADSDEPSRFVREYSGRLKIDNDDGEHAIGTFRAFYVDVTGAVSEGESVLDVFDTYSETVDYLDLYDEDMKYLPSVRKAARAHFVWEPNLLILDRLIIEPQWRGAGRGLLALRCLVEQLRAGAGMVAMKPFPLQKEAHFKSSHAADERRKLELDSFSQDMRVATLSLRRYYAKLGFAKVPRSDLMVLDPCRTLRTKEHVQ